MPTVLEDYFDFSEPEEIRIQGHRILLHHVLDEYLEGMRLEDLCERFDTLSKDEILACLLYYHRNQSTMDRYLAENKVDLARQDDEIRRQQMGLREELRRRLSSADNVLKDSA